MLLPVQTEAYRVSLLKPAANFGSMFLNQAVVAPASCKHILDLLVVEARKENTPTEESLVEAAERCYIDLVAHAKFLGVIVDFSQVSQGGRHLVVVFCPLEQIPQFCKSLARRVYGVLADPNR